MKNQSLPPNFSTNNFHVFAQDACRIIDVRPDQKSIEKVLLATLHKINCPNLIIIVRYKWLKRKGLQIPDSVELPNLCLTIKNGKLIRAFYSETLTNIIKKQNYTIWILN